MVVDAIDHAVPDLLGESRLFFFGAVLGSQALLDGCECEIADTQRIAQVIAVVAKQGETDTMKLLNVLGLQLGMDMLHLKVHEVTRKESMHN
jgi:hypothetical protein